MKCSIVIPTFNEEANIGACISEVKKQALDAEIIIVDAESTDKTVKIAKDLGAKAIVEKKSTISAGRDAGLKKAKGDIICYVDADVIPEKNWFKEMTKPFNDKNVVGVGGICLPIDGTRIEHFGMRLVFGLISPIFFRFQVPIVSGANMAFRRKQAIEVGGFIKTQISGEDTHMFLRIREKGKIVHANAIVCVSTRRIRDWGLFKYLLWNIKNFIHLLKYERPLDDEYEPIRE